MAITAVEAMRRQHPDEIQDSTRQYLAEIEPWAKIEAEMLSQTLGDEQRRIIAGCDRIMELIAQKWIGLAIKEYAGQLSPNTGENR